MTVGALSTDYFFQFDAFTDVLTSLSFLFRQLAMTQTETVKTKDIKAEQLLKEKYEIEGDDPPTPPYTGPVYVEPDNIRQRFDGDVTERKLEMSLEIKQED